MVIGGQKAPLGPAAAPPRPGVGGEGSAPLRAAMGTRWGSGPTGGRSNAATRYKSTNQMYCLTTKVEFAAAGV